MALLQILEPNEKSQHHEFKLAVGIDLGTTNSLISIVKNNQAICIAEEDGEIILPSVVRYCGNHEVIVGSEALSAQKIDPKNTISSVKRLLGKTKKDIQEWNECPYELVENKHIIQIKTREGNITPIEVSSEILKSLKKRVESSEKNDIYGAVITVPAYFDDAQRQATKDAAKLAGLNVLRLLNEPTAAAIAYGLDHQSKGTYVVFDLGGGTFDVSILKMEKGLFQVIATGGDPSLGGDDFDRLIYQLIVQKNQLNDLTDSDTQLLLSLSRSLKEHLTQDSSATIKTTLSNHTDIEFRLTQEEFNQLTLDLVKKTIPPIRQALSDANLNIHQINGVIMVGGATRMPHIQNEIRSFFQQDLLNNLDPDKVVALGASLQANILAGNKSEHDWLLLDVIPLSLGLETYGGLVEKIISRNTTLPVVKAQEFTTFKDGQTSMLIHITQGERDLVSDCRSLAQFILHDIPPMLAGVSRILVTFQVDTDGLLSVFAEEKTTKKKSSIEVKPSYGLDDQTILQMLKDEMSHASEDAHIRKLKESCTEAERLIIAVESALLSDSNLLEQNEIHEIKNSIKILKEKISKDNLSLIEKEITKLNQLTEHFAAKRMNKNIGEILKGKNIKTL